jgi:putative membrane protein
MYINYVALMLVNLVAALALVAYYVYAGLDDKDQKRWAPGFAMSGLVMLVTGLHMIWNWPLPGSYNIAYGEMSVLFGTVLLGTALSLAMSWHLLTVTVYGFFAGLAAIVVGLRIINLSMSKQPLVAGIGFILAGVGGVLAAPTLSLRGNRQLRTIAALILVVAAGIWAVTGYEAYWGHLSDFAKWVPVLMQK